MGDEPKANEPGIVRIIGRSESARAYAIRDFLGRGDVPFEWIEVKTELGFRADSRCAALSAI